MLFTISLNLEVVKSMIFSFLFLLKNMIALFSLIAFNFILVHFCTPVFTHIYIALHLFNYAIKLCLYNTCYHAHFSVVYHFKINH